MTTNKMYLQGKIFLMFPPDNELDKTQTKLELAEKKFKEKSKALIEAKEDAIQLKKQIEVKEQRLKKINEQLNSNGNSLLTSSSK